MIPEPRFFETLSPITLSELAKITGSELRSVEATNLPVNGVSILAKAGEGRVAFLTDRRFLIDLPTMPPTGCFVTAELFDLLPAGWVGLVTRYPHAAYALAASRLHRARQHQEAQAISASARFEANVQLGPGVIVGPGAHIGAGTSIGANTVIGPGVTIGRDSQIGSGVTIGFSLIGDRVHIHSNAVIGEPGFGAAAGPRGIVDLPQLGRVILQDGVTIGAGSTVDRGAYEDTVIGENTKLDNLVHIAHNVQVGRNCVMAAYTGISGSVIIGDGVRLGGRSGVADHLRVGAGAQIGAGAAVLRSVPAGETWSGFPARPIRQWLREVAWVARSSAKTRSGAKHD